MVSLRRELAIARRRLEGVGTKHPSYDAFRSRVAELTAKLGELGGAIDIPVETPPAVSSGAMPVHGGEATADRSGAERTIRISKNTVAAGDFRPLGGWLLPSRGAGGKGLGFSRGGLFVEHGKGDSRFIYLYGHQQTGECHQLKVSLSDMGTDFSKRLEWPTATAVRLIPETHTIEHNQPYNLCRPNPGGPLLTTGRVFYATDPAHWVGPWMNWYDESDRRTTSLAVEPHVNRRQVFGGGFCDIPRWFADAYLGGRDFGVGFGGYRSGQGSSPGPTLFATRRPKDFAPMLDESVELLSFKWGGGRGEREKRPADYSTPLWGPSAVGEDGWWQADLVSAGPVWIDTPSTSGLCYWSVQGLGDLNYALQDVAFSKRRRVRLYVYDPSILAKSYRNDIQPDDVRGSFFEWPLPFDDSDTSRKWPIGAYWDKKDQLLFLAYDRSGKGQYEVPPVVTVYKVLTHKPPKP